MEEFKSNLLLLLHCRYPNGLPIHNVESEYRKFFKIPVPTSLNGSLAISIQTLPHLQPYFEVCRPKNKTTTLIVRAKSGRSDDEMRVIAKLASFAHFESTKESQFRVIGCGATCCALKRNPSALIDLTESDNGLDVPVTTTDELNPPDLDEHVHDNEQDNQHYDVNEKDPFAPSGMEDDDDDTTMMELRTAAATELDFKIPHYLDSDSFSAHNHGTDDYIMQDLQNMKADEEDDENDDIKILSDMNANPVVPKNSDGELCLFVGSNPRNSILNQLDMEDSEHQIESENVNEVQLDKISLVETLLTEPVSEPFLNVNEETDTNNQHSICQTQNSIKPESSHLVPPESKIISDEAAKKNDLILMPPPKPRGKPMCMPKEPKAKPIPVGPQRKNNGAKNNGKDKDPNELNISELVKGIKTPIPIPNTNPIAARAAGKAQNGPKVGTMSPLTMIPPAPVPESDDPNDQIVVLSNHAGEVRVIRFRREMQRCTWMGCTAEFDTKSQCAEHVRTVHLNNPSDVNNRPVPVPVPIPVPVPSTSANAMGPIPSTSTSTATTSAAAACTSASASSSTAAVSVAIARGCKRKAESPVPDTVIKLTKTVPSRIYSCPTRGCDRKFDSETACANHKSRCYGLTQQNTRRFICTFPRCYLSYETIEARDEHMKVHEAKSKGKANGIGTFKCDVPGCKCTFRTESRLKIHRDRCVFKHNTNKRPDPDQENENGPKPNQKKT